MQPGKVQLNSFHSMVEINQDSSRLYGTRRTSRTENFVAVFGDEYVGPEDGSKCRSGFICLIENDYLLWIKDIEKPTNAAVAGNGTVIITHTHSRDLSKESSKPEEFKNLGGTLTVIEKSGETLMTSVFGSNLSACAISAEGDFVSTASLYPDNSVYCFRLSENKLLWKYKSHLRKKPVVSLQFVTDGLEVFAGNSIATSQKEYVLTLDGTLYPEYQERVETLGKVKRHRPEDKARSLVGMLNSDDGNDVKEGLSELEPFVKTKGSLLYYADIVHGLKRHLQDEDAIIQLVWKVIRQIQKKKHDVLNSIIPEFISRIKRISGYDDTGLLAMLGELGGTNPQWIIEELQFIKEKLKSKAWNERRFAAFAIGSVGSVEPSLIKDSVAVLIEFASDPDKLRNELNELNRNYADETFGFTISVSTGIDSAIWIRDACIDAIGMIGAQFPEAVNQAIPLLEKLSNEAPSPYTLKKARRSLEAIRRGPQV